ncbi:MAG: thioredoxin [Mucilaginibacter sp.]|nr:thioredoxin [Mucilaginibacter sp.]
MKKNILILFILLPLAGWCQNEHFTLNVHTRKPVTANKIYLIYLSGKDVITDSAAYTADVRFSGKIAGPVRATLRMGNQRNADELAFYFENGEISLTVKDSLKYAVVKGSKINDEYLVYQKAIEAPQKEIERYTASLRAATAANKTDTVYIQSLKAGAQKANADQKQAALQFIKSHPNYFISLVALWQVAGYRINGAEIGPVFETLSPEVQNTTSGKALATLIKAAKSVTIGSKAPVFTQVDTSGRLVSLADFKGKYVLLDFWASWCVPCRGENPNVVKAYHQYKDKNFTVVSVSLDLPGKRENWLAAIKADHLEWTQLSDLKFWDNAVAKQYAIRSIPQNFLIDPSGNVIAADLRGTALQSKLAELLK